MFVVSFLGGKCEGQVGGWVGYACVSVVAVVFIVVVAVFVVLVEQLNKYLVD